MAGDTAARSRGIRAVVGLLGAVALLTVALVAASADGGAAAAGGGSVASLAGEIDRQTGRAAAVFAAQSSMDAVLGAGLAAGLGLGAILGTVATYLRGRE